MAHNIGWTGSDMVCPSCGHAWGAVHKTLERVECPECGQSVQVGASDQSHLEGRKARCYGHRAVDSDIGLAFFEYRPDREDDVYYCGCHGWD